MKYVRKTRRGLEVPTHVYTNKKTGEEIVLSGVIHVAHDDFWASIKHQIELADDRGYAVHLEGVGKADSPTKLSDETVQVMSNLMKMMVLPKEIAEIVGLTYQSDAMALYLKTLPRVDLNIVEVINSLPVSARKRLAEREVPEIMAKEDRPEFLGDVFLFVLRNIHILSAISKALPWVSSPMDDHVIIDLRNEYAIKHALAEPKQKRLLLWGAAHLKGMGILLKTAGYTRTSTEWRVAIPKDHRAPTAK